MSAGSAAAAGPGDLAGAIDALVEGVGAVWAAYLANGPDRVDAALYGPVEQGAAAVEACLGAGGAGMDAEGRADLLAAVETARDLAQRCACTALGLSFVTGEAGLIPRKDQHQAMDGALAHLRAVRAEMAGGAGGGA